MKRDNLADLAVDGKVMLKWILHNLEGVGWIDLIQDWGKWRALVTAVMNIWYP
jgi:hypothetical protein